MRVIVKRLDNRHRRHRRSRCRRYHRRRCRRCRRYRRHHRFRRCHRCRRHHQLRHRLIKLSVQNLLVPVIHSFFVILLRNLLNAFVVKTSIQQQLSCGSPFWSLILFSFFSYLILVFVFFNSVKPVDSKM